MEEFKTFYDLAEKVEPWEPGEEFTREFREYMEKVILESRKKYGKSY